MLLPHNINVKCTKHTYKNYTMWIWICWYAQQCTVCKMMHGLVYALLSGMRMDKHAIPKVKTFL